MNDAAAVRRSVAARCALYLRVVVVASARWCSLRAAIGAAAHAAAAGVAGARARSRWRRLVPAELRVGRRPTVGIDDTFFITTALLFGPAPATLAIAADALVFSLRRRQPVRQIAFNAAALALVDVGRRAAPSSRSRGVAPLARQRTRRSRRWSCRCWRSTVVYFVLNSGLTAVAVGLDSAAVADRHLDAGTSAGCGSAISARRRWRSA